MGEISVKDEWDTDRSELGETGIGMRWEGLRSGCGID